MAIRAELERLHSEAETFQMAYRMKADVETKSQAVEIQRLQELEAAAVEWSRLDDVHEGPETLWPDDLTELHLAAYARLRTLCRAAAKARKK